MQDRHINRDKYFFEQNFTTKNYVLPFIADIITVDKGTSVLEVGCGEGGNLVPFINAGCQRVVGVDISEQKITNAQQYLNRYSSGNAIELIHDDIYNLTPSVIGQFDIIFARDVLEHIHDQNRFLRIIKQFLKPNGKLFLGFPSWQNPFGGHQQICESRVLSKLPFFHLLPRLLYSWILKLFGESDQKVGCLLEIKETGISIERFERIATKELYKIEKRDLYFINPNYQIKFGLKPRKASKLIVALPFVRNFILTSNYYLLSL